MHATTFHNFDWKLLIAFWLCLALALGPVKAGAETGEDCDEYWSHKAGPLNFTTDCEYILGTGYSELPTGHVTQDLLPLCPNAPELSGFQLRFRVMIDTGQLKTRFGQRFGIFELWEAAVLAPERMIYLELEDQGILESEYGVVLHWRADGLSGQENSSAIVDPGIALIAVEWSRSYDSDHDGQVDDNGTIRLFLNEVLIAEVSGLRFWNLPGAANYGVFETIGTNVEGSLTFRPVDYSVRYFRPQGAGSGL